MKDPAFLFYSSDFLNGIADLTMEERGQYITLLCLQHVKGELTEKTIRLTVGSVSVDVLDKFRKTENGNYLNTRLQEEIEKRAAYTSSRRQNGKKGGRPPKNSTIKEEINHNETKIETTQKPYGYAYNNHIENVNVNENENVNEIKKGGVGEKKSENHMLTAEELLSEPSNQTWFQISILKNLRITPQEAAKRLTHYSLRCESDGKYFDPTNDLRACRAGFQKWCLSWTDNEASKPKPKNQSRVVTGSIQDEHAKFQELLLQNVAI
jgi:uncharacterized protein YdaU (DUF1376 family)